MVENKINDKWEKYWKSKDLKHRIIEWMRKKYFSKIFAKAIMQHVRHGVVLEAGCGTGLISYYLGSKFTTIGCDMSLEALSGARSHCKYVVACDVHKLCFKNNSLELIFNQGVMEHFNDTEIINILEQFKRVAKNVVVILPSKTSIFRIYNPFKEVSGKDVFFSKKRLQHIFSRVFHNFSVRYLANSFFISIVGHGSLYNET